MRHSHVASSQDNNWHAHCPKGEDSWYGYQRDESMGTNIYKPGGSQKKS